MLHLLKEILKNVPWARRELIVDGKPEVNKGMISKNKNKIK